MWCAADNHNNMCHIRAKQFTDSNFNYAVIYKISKFTYSQNLQPLLPYKFHDRDMEGIYFFIFASCELLRIYLCLAMFGATFNLVTRVRIP